MPSTFYRLLLLLLFLSRICAAQQIFNHRVYNESDGMLSSDVIDITQATDGSIWISTLVGVSQYDGNRWTNYSSETYNLPKFFETKIRSSADGKIWVAGHIGKKFVIKYWDNNRWHNFSHPFRQLDTTEILFDLFLKNGKLKIVAGHRNVYEYNSEKEEWFNINLPVITKPTSLYTHSLKYDQEGVLWACTIDGLKKYQSEKWTTVTTAHPNNEILAVSFAKKDNMPYVLGGNFISYVENDTLKNLLTFQSDFKGDSVHQFSNILIDKNDEIFFNNYSPLLKVKKNSIERVLFNSNLKDVTSIRSIFEDRENNIWVATARGLVKLTNPLFLNYTKNSGLIENEVTAILELKKEKAFLLGANKGFTIYKDNSFTPISIHTETLFGNERILRILSDKRGTVYFAGNGLGLGIWNQASPVKWIPAPPHKESQVVGEIFQDEDDIYIVSIKSILRLNSDNSFSKVYTQKAFIRKTHRLSSGEILLLSDDILVFNKGNVQKKYTFDRVQNESVYGVAEWNNELLVATRLGLYKVNGDKIQPTIIKGYTIDVPVYGLLVDSKNNLWAGTAKGIYQFTADNTNHYDQSNGLIGDEINRNALIEDSDGKIWIGTEKGVSIFQYSQANENTPPPCLS